MSSLEDRALKAGKVLVLIVALHEVGLWRGRCVVKSRLCVSACVREEERGGGEKHPPAGSR